MLSERSLNFFLDGGGEEEKESAGKGFFFSLLSLGPWERGLIYAACIRQSLTGTVRLIATVYILTLFFRHLVAVVQAWINISDSESDSDSELSDPQVTNNNGHAIVHLTTDQNDQRASEANLQANTPGKTTCITVKPWREDRIYKLQNVFSGSARFIGKLRHKKEFRRKFQFEKYIMYLEKVSRREGFCIGVVLITWELVSALFFFLISLIALFIQESIFGKAESTIKI